jgi:sugar phosphate isomerase/epimerase
MKRRDLLAATLAACACPASYAAVRPGERKSTPGAPFKLGLAAYSYRKYLQGAAKRMSLLDFIRAAAELGTDGVELTEYYFPKPITLEFLREVKRAAQLWGQTITGTPIGNQFTFPAGMDRDRQVETYRRWVDVSATLGSPTIRTFAGSAPKGISETDARRHVIETLKGVCDYAGERGVFVALENHGGVVAEPDGLLEIVQAVESPWLGINLDTGNFRTVDPYADLERCAPYAITAQYKVEISPKGSPAQPADFGRILKILRGAGYRGFVTLEHESREEPDVAVPRHLREMRRLMLTDAAAAA